MMGSKWELAQRREKHSCYLRHQETLSAQLSNLPNIWVFPGLISGKKGRGKPGSLAAQSPSCLWNLLHVLHPCLAQGDNLNCSYPVPQCLWNFHLRDALDFVLQEEITTHILTLCGSAEALLVARLLTGPVPKVHWQKHLKFWPFFVSYPCADWELPKAEKSTPVASPDLGSAKLTTEMHTIFLVPTASVCKSLPNQGWDDNASFTVIRNDTEDDTWPLQCFSFQFLYWLQLLWMHIVKQSCPEILSRVAFIYQEIQVLVHVICSLKIPKLHVLG